MYIDDLVKKEESLILLKQKKFCTCKHFQDNLFKETTLYVNKKKKLQTIKQIFKCKHVFAVMIAEKMKMCQNFTISSVEYGYNIQNLMKKFA